MPFLALFAIVAAAVGQIRQSETASPVAMMVRLGAGDTVSFRLSQRVVTDIDLHVRDADYSVPLQCVGGLRDVHVETVELQVEAESERANGSFVLLFDVGKEQDRKFGTLPRVQLSFRRGRLIEMLLTSKTSERASFSAKLCSTLPVGPITCRDTRQLQGLPPETLVQQLRHLPAPIPAGGRPTESETRRGSIYEELLDWGARSIPPLVAGLKDPDVRLRRNVTLAFGALGGGWWPFECGRATLDIRSALPALVTAFADSDPNVRGWAAQAVGGMGADAADAVPALIELLKNGDTGSRNSACIALGRIGPPAKAALPALRAALSDESQDVRRAAARAIERIEQQ